MPLEELIDGLVNVDKRAPGLHDMAIFGGFLGDANMPAFQTGVLGSEPPSAAPQMRSLVRRGVEALPALIAHLNDARPTKLVVGSSFPPKTSGSFFFMFQYFSDEYDPRSGPRRFCVSACMQRFFNGEYVVRVGDICFVLIGQIVNRRLQAVRYQPTAGLVVNSPIEAPSLVERTRSDWGGLDPHGHEQALLADLQSANRLDTADALTRLRFYYPKTYAALTGQDATKREAFESAERR